MHEVCGTSRVLVQGSEGAPGHSSGGVRPGTFAVRLRGGVLAFRGSGRWDVAMSSGELLRLSRGAMAAATDRGNLPVVNAFSVACACGSLRASDPSNVAHFDLRWRAVTVTSPPTSRARNRCPRPSRIRLEQSPSAGHQRGIPVRGEWVAGVAPSPGDGAFTGIDYRAGVDSANDASSASSRPPLSTRSRRSRVPSARARMCAEDLMGNAAQVAQKSGTSRRPQLINPRS